MSAASCQRILQIVERAGELTLRGSLACRTGLANARRTVLLDVSAHRNFVAVSVGGGATGEGRAAMNAIVEIPLVMVGVMSVWMKTSVH